MILKNHDLHWALWNTPIGNYSLFEHKTSSNLELLNINFSIQINRSKQKQI